MAVLSPKSPLHGLRGKIGDLIFRSHGNKTVVQTYTEPSRKRTELQKLYNNKMQQAATAARAALRDPATRAHYEKKKKRLNVTSAYTAACTDFLRKGKIDYIDTTRFNKGQITIKAYKPDFGIEQVTVKLTTLNGKPVLEGIATPKPNGEYHFKFQNPPALSNTIITVHAKDKTGNITSAVYSPLNSALSYDHLWPVH